MWEWPSYLQCYVPLANAAHFLDMFRIWQTVTEDRGPPYVCDSSETDYFHWIYPSIRKALPMIPTAIILCWLSQMHLWRIVSRGAGRIKMPSDTAAFHATHGRLSVIIVNSFLLISLQRRHEQCITFSISVFPCPYGALLLVSIFPLCRSANPLA